MPLLLVDPDAIIPDLTCGALDMTITEETCERESLKKEFINIKCHSVETEIIKMDKNKSKEEDGREIQDQITKEVLESLPQIVIVDRAASPKYEEMFHGFFVDLGATIST